MRRRLLESLGVAAVMVALVIFLQLSAAGQAPAARGTQTASGPAAEDRLGPSRSPGDLARRVRYSARTARSVREQGVLHRRRSATAQDEERVRQHRPQPPRRARQPAGRRRRLQRRVHVGEADGPADVAGRRSAERPDSRAHGGDARAEPARSRVPPGAASEHRDLQEQGDRPAPAGQYGPPSPRFAEVPPFYNTQRMNRHDGPEDQSMGDRCMSGQEPDFSGFRRIVQRPDPVAIGIDTGQGQGFQRVVYLTGSHPPSSDPPAPRRLARPLRGQYAGRRDHELLAEVPVPRRRREPEAGRTLHADRCEHARVHGHGHRSDGVDGAVDGQAGADDAVGRAEPHLLRAAVPRGELRAAGAARRRAHGREGVRGRDAVPIRRRRTPPRTSGAAIAMAEVTARHHAQLVQKFD